MADSGTLRNEVGNMPIGKEVKITVFRQGRKEDLTIRIGNLDDSIKFLAAAGKELLGAEVRNLTSQEAEKFGLDLNQRVMVTRLDAKGSLREAGFEVRDVILGINNQPIQRVDTFATRMDYLKPHQKIAFAALDYRTGNRGMV